MVPARLSWRSSSAGTARAAAAGGARAPLRVGQLQKRALEPLEPPQLLHLLHLQVHFLDPHIQDLHILLEPLRLHIPELLRLHILELHLQVHLQVHILHMLRFLLEPAYPHMLGQKSLMGTWRCTSSWGGL